MSDDVPAAPEDRPATTVGARLRAGREAQGLTVAEVAARTRVPQRHLEAIEDGNYDSLPSRTYAVGFVKAYARAINADEVALGHDARDEVARTMRPPVQYQPYETADPARVPSRGLVIAASGIALAVLVLAILWFATGLFGNRPADAPDAAMPPVAIATPAVEPSPTPTPEAGGQVTLAASDEVWLRVYDAANTTLYLGTMKPGERFDVPRDANQPMINVGRPDKLTVTLNGSAIPPLGDGSRPIKDVGVDAEAVAARLSGTSVPAASPTPGPTATPTSAPRSAAAAGPAAAPRPAAARTPAARPTPRRDGPENLLPKTFDQPPGG